MNECHKDRLRAKALYGYMHRGCGVAEDPAAFEKAIPRACDNCAEKDQCTREDKTK